MQEIPTQTIDATVFQGPALCIAFMCNYRLDPAACCMESASLIELEMWNKPGSPVEFGQMPNLTSLTIAGLFVAPPGLADLPLLRVRMFSFIFGAAALRPQSTSQLGAGTDCTTLA